MLVYEFIPAHKSHVHMFQIGEIFAAVKAVVLKNLGNLKTAVMKGASAIQEACKTLLVECKNVSSAELLVEVQFARI